MNYSDMINLELCFPDFETVNFYPIKSIFIPGSVVNP